MTNENKHASKSNLRKDYYNVPEGYFETLTSRVMANIPEDDSSSLFTPNIEKKNKRYVWISTIAASIVAIISIAHFVPMLTNSEGTNFSNTEFAAENVSDNYQEDMLNYSAIDGAVVYNYLQGAEY